MSIIYIRKLKIPNKKTTICTPKNRGKATHISKSNFKAFTTRRLHVTCGASFLAASAYDRRYTVVGERSQTIRTSRPEHGDNLQKLLTKDISRLMLHVCMEIFTVTLIGYIIQLSAGANWGLARFCIFNCCAIFY